MFSWLVALYGCFALIVRRGPKSVIEAHNLAAKQTAMVHRLEAKLEEAEEDHRFRTGIALTEATELAAKLDAVIGERRPAQHQCRSHNECTRSRRHLGKHAARVGDAVVAWDEKTVQVLTTADGVVVPFRRVK